MNSEEQELLMETLNEYRQHLTIVEGKNDKRALERYGFTNVRTIDRPLYRVVEEIDEEEIMILTDLDRHGRKLYHYFFRECGRRGVKVNNRLRQLLVFSELRQIEGLPRYLERLN